MTLKKSDPFFQQIFFYIKVPKLATKDLASSSEVIDSGLIPSQVVSKIFNKEKQYEFQAPSLLVLSFRAAVPKLGSIDQMSPQYKIFEKGLPGKVFRNVWKPLFYTVLLTSFCKVYSHKFVKCHLNGIQLFKRDFLFLNKLETTEF